MAILSRELRKTLENVVAEAREVAEEAAAKALQSLAVEKKDPYTSMTAVQKALRNRLRAHGRQLGDRRNVEKGTQELDHLMAECAYEHWHRMLFARFLAESHLLLEPESGVALAIEEVKELARERGQDWVALAGEYAIGMLPQVFRQDDPVLEVQLAPEDRKRLEELLESLSAAVFSADDSLGWTYQFWQKEEKNAINASGKKIGADELGPVTQLFTEDYMVEFLLHNTLGAWWVGRRYGGSLEAGSEEEARAKVGLPGVSWTYLRFIKDDKTGRWRPAAGTFEGWPKAARDVTVLDPCMGSGHFLVFALPLIAAMRAAEEGCSAKVATIAALKQNLFGLELDLRCTQIAAFNLALAAWRRVGYCALPAMNLACAGLAPNANEAEWLKLADGNQKLQSGMGRLYRLFSQAPVLGSLINPRASEEDLLVAAFHELQPLLEHALAQEAKDDTAHEMAVTAQGVAKAGEILSSDFTLVATNVPYLGDRKQSKELRKYCVSAHPRAKANLATCFVGRCLQLTAKGGTSALVTPQNWLLQDSYKHVRERLLQEAAWQLLVKLGPGAFETVTGEVVDVVLIGLGNLPPSADTAMGAYDASTWPSAQAKAMAIRAESFQPVSQASQQQNPDCRVTLDVVGSVPLLGKFAIAPQGIITGDMEKWVRRFWEIAELGTHWKVFLSTATSTAEYSGREHVIDWSSAGAGMIRPRNGNLAVGKQGVAISQMGQVSATLYCGELYDGNIAPIVPTTPQVLDSLWAFCSDPSFEKTVRRIDRKVNLTNGSLLKVPFDAAHWSRVAKEKYPTGSPKPFSSDPTQWLFNGHPKSSDQPLHVAVARLLGYRWPRQTGSNLPGSAALGPDGLEPHADSDGIVCLESLKGEEPAEARLRKLLAAAYGDEWSASKQAELLAQVEFGGESLGDWLLDGFFEQHCELFHQRPFVWHVWDGLRDGFHALLNYHRLVAPKGEGRRTFERLTFGYLGDWISRQKAEQRLGKEGADEKLAAALHLQEALKGILAGEPPYDIFVRWKPLPEQEIEWQPDINDGVRMNIRPFVMAETLRGKSIFRKAPKIKKWKMDGGKEPDRPKHDFPWFWGWDGQTVNFVGGRAFDGNRWNDLHYSNSVKKEARVRCEGKER